MNDSREKEVHGRSAMSRIGNFFCSSRHSDDRKRWELRVLGIQLIQKTRSDRYKKLKVLGIPLLKRRNSQALEEQQARQQENEQRQNKRLLQEVQKLQRLQRDAFYLHFRDHYHKPQLADAGEYFSRFLLLQCDCLELATTWGMNLGDYVQATAVKGMAERCFPEIPATFAERDTLSLYCGEKAFTVMQGWFSHNHYFLPNERVWPVYVGCHVKPKTREEIIHFLRFNPHYFDGHSIGCRDRSTLAFFRKVGADAYFSRCFTMTLPRRTQEPRQGKVFLVDVPESMEAFIPEELKKDAVRLSQRKIREEENTLENYVNRAEYYMDAAAERLRLYREEAALVITTAVHCASPCTAMGIPVVLISAGGEDPKRRFDFLSDILPIWSVADLRKGAINWSPTAPDIEALKDDMALNLRLTIEWERTGNKPAALDAVRERIAHPNISR